MGKIRERLGQLGDRAFGTPQEREERRKQDQIFRQKERAAYDKAYSEERVRQASKRGRPIGGQSPDILRQYWREKQRQSREMRSLLRKGKAEFSGKTKRRRKK